MLQTFTFIGGRMHGKKMTVPEHLDEIVLPLSLPVINQVDAIEFPDFSLPMETYVREWADLDDGGEGKWFFMLQGMCAYEARRFFLDSIYGQNVRPIQQSMVNHMLDSADDNPDEMLRRILKKAQRHFVKG